MPVQRYTPRETARRGKEWYQRDIRSRVDIAENFGKMLIINVDTGEYEMNDDDLTATHRLLDKDPEAQLYGMRIGYPAAVKMGGAWPSRKA
uniref:Uncharacterized protein n=1 Tax=uncultured Armatimonadetes bacterium TaxID=157466 RepID=A0A6J4K6R1_9BACT|nr:hypothetical protein AVDCRST_MAG63-4930 [uncultured Armatimonadetes bacterium]